MQKYRVEVDEMGNVCWYRFGTNVLHRLGGPAIEWYNGTKAWLQDGEQHRVDGPAIEYPNGTKMWFQNGERHRLDGPAVERADGYREYYKNGLLHRLDGPAIMDINDPDYKEYYINGKKYSEKTWEKEVKKLQNPTCHSKIVEIEGKKYRLEEVE